MISAAAANIVATCVLAAILAAVAGWLWVQTQRLGFGPAAALLFGLNQVMARVLWRAEASGPLAIDPGQGAIIVSNHQGPFDPSFVYLATHRIVHWMVAVEYCNNPLLKGFFRAAQSIPVSRRGIDTAATKMAIRYAKEGGLVGLFPEGKINTTGQLLLPGRAGAAIIAIKARVPVVPCYVSGSPNDGTSWGFLFMPAKARLRVGRPIDTSPYWDRPDDRQAAEDLTRAFMREIARLAGHNDFEPKVAGRFRKPRLDDA